MLKPGPIEALWRKAPELVLAAGFGAFAVLAIVLLWPRPTPLPPAERATVDSLIATKPDYRRRVDTLTKVDSDAARQSRVNAARARQAVRTADSLRGAAIGWQRVADAEGDTSTAWKATALAYRAEADTLRVGVHQLDSALTAQTAAHAAADRRAREAEQRAAALESLNARLARDLQHAAPPCRVLWLRCPSRKLAYVAGALTVPVAYAATRLLSPPE
jgi:hypothetical protein